MSFRPRFHVSLAFVALIVLGGLLSSCRGEPVTPTEEGPQVQGYAAKGSKPVGTTGDIAISAVDPDTVTTDTVLTVRVLGSGFSAGSEVSWALAGSLTNAVSTIPPVLFISSRELLAKIAVSREATLARYDVVVTAMGGKKGIGVEKLEVVAKPILLPVPSWVKRSEARDVNDEGVIVGWGVDGADVSHPLRWTPRDGGWVVEELTPGAVPPGVARSPRDLTNDGYVLLHTYELDPVSLGLLWQRWSVLTPGGQEVEVEARYLSAMNDKGTIIGTDSQGRPAAWRRLSASGWSDPIPLPSLTGYQRPSVLDINNNDEIGGTIRRLDDWRMEWAAVWRYQNGQWSAPVLLDEDFGGCALVINDQGAVAGCHWPCFDATCTSLPAFWASVGAPRLLLPIQSAPQTTGLVNDVNEWNLICGSAPVRIGGKRGAIVQHAVVWRPGVDQARDLGAIRGGASSTAHAINNAWPAVAVGVSQQTFGGEQATVWLVF